MKLLSALIQEWLAFAGLKNPHNVTLTQANVLSKTEVDTALSAKCKGRLLPIMYFCRATALPTPTYSAGKLTLPAAIASYNGFDKTVPALTVTIAADADIYLAVDPNMNFSYVVGAITTSNYWNYVKIGKYVQSTTKATLQKATKVATTVIEGAA